MKALALTAEAGRQLRRRPVASSALAAILAASSALILIMVGGAQARADDLAAQLHRPDYRTVTIRAKSETALDVASARRMQRIAGVESILPVAQVLTASNATFTDGGPSIGIYLVASLSGLNPKTASGRAIGQGEVALSTASMTELGLRDHAGTVRDTNGAIWAVVGNLPPVTTDASTALPGVALAQLDDTAPLTYVQVTIDEAHRLSDAARWMIAVAAEPAQVTVEYNTDLETVSRAASTALSGSNRTAAALSLIAAIVAVALMTFASAAAQRRDVARRRALGASRSTIVTLLSLNATLSALIGTAIGTAIALAVLNGRHHIPPTSFILATGVLCLLAASVAAIPGAMLGAVREPATILRVP
jgi:putative ABC transport system permease protein